MATAARTIQRGLRLRALAALEAMGTAALAGLIAGVLVGGVGSRIAMRIAGAMSDPALVGIARTNNDNIVGDITFGGTFALIVFGGLLPGLAGGAIYLLARPWLAPFGRWGGVAFGLALLASFGASVIEPFNIDFRKFGAPALNVAMFALLFPLFGAIVAVASTRIERAIDDGPTVSGWYVAVVVAALLLLALCLLVLAAGLVNVVSGRVEWPVQDPRGLLLFLTFLAVTLLPRIVFGRDRPLADARELPAAPRVATYALLVAPALLGLPAVVSSIAFLTRP
jgi:hypothetical protein